MRGLPRDVPKKESTSHGEASRSSPAARDDRRCTASLICYGRAAGMFASTARYAKTNRYAMAIAARNGAYELGATVLGANVSGYLGAHEVMHTVSDVPNVSLGDFIPIAASIRDFQQMTAACGY